MLQLNWSNSQSSKERNLSLPPASYSCLVPPLPLCEALALARLSAPCFWQEPACFSAVFGWWQMGSFRTRGASLSSLYPECNIGNVLLLII